MGHFLQLRSFVCAGAFAVITYLCGSDSLQQDASEPALFLFHELGLVLSQASLWG